MSVRGRAHHSRSARNLGARCALGLTLLASRAVAQGVDPFSDTPVEAPAPPTPAPPAPVRPVAFEASLGLRLTHRALRWRDDLFGEQRDYTLPVGPYVALDLQWFPAAHATAAWPAHLGVYASGGVAFGLDSTDARGRSLDTRAYDLRGGLLGRVPLGAHALTVGVGYERRAFAVTRADPDDAFDPGVPGVTYESLTVDVDARFRASRRLALSIGATGALPLRFGDLAERLFPNASGASVELRGGAAWAVGGAVELRAVASYRRYFLAMNPSPGDRWIAGGLLDEFASLTLSAALRR